MDELEYFLGTFVAKTLGGTAIPRDVKGASDNTRDFDIELPDRIAALEITSVVDEAEVAQSRALQKHQPSCPNLSRHWHLSLQPETNIRALVGRVCSLLRALELCQVDTIVPDRKLDPSDPDWALENELRSTPEVEELRNLGVQGATSFTQGPAGLITTGSHSLFSTHPDLVVEAVEVEASKDDNRRKLAASGSTDRHLFVWVERNPEAGALAFPLLPETLPRLPVEVTTVWVATGGYADEGLVIQRCWRVSPPDEWKDVPCRHVTGTSNSL